MENDAGIARRQVEIVNTYGLHMRPSSRFVKPLPRAHKGPGRLDFTCGRRAGS